MEENSGHDINRLSNWGRLLAYFLTWVFYPFPVAISKKNRKTLINGGGSPPTKMGVGWSEWLVPFLLSSMLCHTFSLHSPNLARLQREQRPTESLSWPGYKLHVQLLSTTKPTTGWKSWLWLFTNVTKRKNSLGFSSMEHQNHMGALKITSLPIGSYLLVSKFC